MYIHLCTCTSIQYLEGESMRGSLGPVLVLPCFNRKCSGDEADFRFVNGKMASRKWHRPFTKRKFAGTRWQDRNSNSNNLLPSCFYWYFYVFLIRHIFSGYATHMVGKWHLGFFEWTYTPTYRGFDSHYGFYTGCGDHYKHERLGILDLRDNTSPVRDMNGTYSANLFTKVRRILGTIHPFKLVEEMS